MAKDIQISQEAMAAAADEASQVMSALSNPARLMLLCQLVEGEKTVGDLERALGLSQAYVSQQLARLRACGMVESTPDGRARRYRLSDSRLAPVLQAIYEQFCPVT